ncbi:hypothetical protein V2S66_04045 [Streptomyces sp. V4-01]|uniref:Uncharacterized protein n=1 Tax=Actinacidiphila polyblastidii TaxID=3110430 RepID=A0ABU7P5R4_9ACTN|nr:hypothetical protein [Streptomyces sp. V4-01]
MSFRTNDALESVDDATASFKGSPNPNAARISGRPTAVTSATATAASSATMTATATATATASSRDLTSRDQFLMR